MEGSLKLVGYKLSPTTQYVTYVARYAKASVEVENVAWNEEERRKELKSQTPTGTFPYLTTQEGNLSESNAIIQYLCESFNASLLGSNAFEKATVRQWVDFANIEVYRSAANLIYPLFGWGEYCKEQSDKAMKTLKENLLILNHHLEGKTYIVGSNLTLADLTMFHSLRSYFQLVLVEDMRKKLFPNVTTWFVNLANQEQAIRAFGRTILCKSPIKPPKVEKKEEVKPKKEEPKPKKEESNAEHAGDDEEKSTKKPKNPLDALPPSSFVLDDWKREFLNSKDQPSVLKAFWDKYDPAGYSLYTMQYQKLPSEGKLLFKTKNFSGMFLQKLDHFRKYSFSAHGVYGVEGEYEVRGLWMWRGVGIPQEVQEHDSFAYMTIKQLDHNNEADRHLVESYWLNL